MAATPSIQTRAKDVAGYEQTKSALHSTPEEPLPKTLVRKLLQAQVRETR